MMRLDPSSTAAASAAVAIGKCKANRRDGRMLWRRDQLPCGSKCCSQRRMCPPPPPPCRPSYSLANSQHPKHLNHHHQTYPSSSSFKTELMFLSPRTCLLNVRETHPSLLWMILVITVTTSQVLLFLLLLFLWKRRSPILPKKERQTDRQTPRSHKGSWFCSSYWIVIK